MVSAWTKRAFADLRASAPPRGPVVAIATGFSHQETVTPVVPRETAERPAETPAAPAPSLPDGDGLFGWQVAVKLNVGHGWHLSHTDLMAEDEARREAQAWRLRGHAARVVEVREVPR